MPTLPTIPDDIGIIAGPTLIGINLNWGLLGVAMVQIYIYHLSSFKDPKWVKIMVYFLGALELIQSALASVDGYHWFAKGFGNMITLDDPYISAFDSPFLDGLIALMVQLFFCYRIWVLHKSYFLVAAVAIMSFTQAAGAMAVGIQGHIEGSLASIPKHLAAQILWLGGSALADTLIAGIMTYTLLKSRNSAFPTANKLVLKIVRLIIETNTLTASTALLALILVLAAPDKPTLSVPVSYVFGKLYTNTFLAVLNNRLLLQQKKAPVTFGSSFNPNNINTPEQGGHLPSHTGEEYDLGVRMHTEVYTCADDGQDLRENSIVSLILT